MISMMDTADCGNTAIMSDGQRLPRLVGEALDALSSGRTYINSACDIPTMISVWPDVFTPAVCRAAIPAYEELDAHLRARDADLLAQWPAARGLIDQIGHVGAVLHALRMRS